MGLVERIPTAKPILRNEPQPVWPTTGETARCPGHAKKRTQSWLASRRMQIYETKYHERIPISPVDENVAAYRS